MNVLTAVLLIVVVFFSVLFLINNLYKRTNHYLNSLVPYKDCKKNCLDAKFINLGSTYAKYAFGAYDDLQVQGNNLAMCSQSLNEDRLMLCSHLSKITKGTIVFIPVAACLFLYDDNMNAKLIKNNFSQRPTIFHCLKSIKYIFHDDRYIIDDIYEMSPVYCLNYKPTLDSLENVWKKLFHLKNLKQVHLSKENAETINKNTNTLREIIEVCLQNKLKPVIISTPFSDELNSRFSAEFKNEMLYNPIKKIVSETGVAYIDFQTRKEFVHCPELFIDGGFCLNKRGSKIFLKMLIEEVIKEK